MKIEAEISTEISGHDASSGVFGCYTLDVMAQEIDIGGVKYVSSKRAAQVSGYAQDYIGQLCRGGLIEAQRVGGLWYLVLDSLYAYKQKADSYVPTAPRKTSVPDASSLVSFDGNDYVSAARAADLTGYHQDYVGQLAREGKVLSRQVGTRWYVEREGVLAHKKEKDALLAAVQSEAVGLARRIDKQPESLAIPSHIGDQTFLKYTTESGDLIPALHEAKEPDLPLDNNTEISEAADGGQTISIRVLRGSPESTERSSRKEESHAKRKQSSYRVAFVAATGLVGTVVIVISLGYASFQPHNLFTTLYTRESGSALAGKAIETFDGISLMLEKILVPTITYQRIEPSFEL